MLKIHFFHSETNHLLENLGKDSEEQGESFHREIKKIMESQYSGCWNALMLAENSLCVQQDSTAEHSMASKRHSFVLCNDHELRY